MKFRTWFPLTIIGILVLSCLWLVGAHLHYVTYETHMLVAVSYPPSEQPPSAFQFDEQFWSSLSRHPKVRKLLDDEQVDDASAWLDSRFTCEPIRKSSEIFELRLYRDRQDVSSLDDYPDILRTIAETMRDDVEANGAQVEVLQTPTLPMRKGLLTNMATSLR